VSDSAAAAAVEKGSWGGRRHGKSAEEHRLAGTFRRDRHDPSYRPKAKPLELDDPVVWVAERIGISPRVAALRPDLADRFEVVPPGEHVDRFLRHFCRHTRAVPDGPPLGSPFGLYPEQREFLDEALEVDEHGRRVYSRAAEVVPRKTGKTTKSAGLALYFGSPADGEHRPEVILGAGTLKQTGKLFSALGAFVNDPQYGSVELGQLFDVLTTEIRCPSIGGVIQRVAGDGDSNHSLDPSVLIADELHTWKTPKQRENWKALTTAQGAREDPFVLAISTEGEGDENELAQLLGRIETDPRTEVEQRRSGLTIYRNRDAGMLVFKYAIPQSATIDSIDDFVRANPAPWRTKERIAKDLADAFVDEPTKLRLYGNRRAQHKERWIPEDWIERARKDLEIPEREPDGRKPLVSLGLDASRYHDTTAVTWAYLRDDGREVHRTHVFGARPDVLAHEYEDGEIDYEALEQYVLGLRKPFRINVLVFDPRYVADTAQRLSRKGIRTADFTQHGAKMLDASQSYYRAWHDDKISLPVDPDAVFEGHLRDTAAVAVEGGWRISKLRSEQIRMREGAPRRPVIDAVTGSMMAHYALHHVKPSPYSSRGLYVVGASAERPETVIVCLKCQSEKTHVEGNLVVCDHCGERWKP
jgi:hypothetical protein